ncbi:alpha/beta hydrolase [Deinococcus altitudinis]|uniref:alpha/beta hydrolase n=1 Tax=Deinococcus altitudinis TaxID=468914 RepID=UPI003891E954
MRSLSLLLFALFTVALSFAVAAPAAIPAAPAPKVQTFRLDQPDGPSFLLVPDTCARDLGCSLVVVSHPRGQTAEHLSGSPAFAAYAEALTRSNFAVLFSNDGGLTPWGVPAALANLTDLQTRSTELFRFNGRTYAFGVSMGGLLALRSAQQGLYPVSGVVLLDAWADLQGAWAIPGRHRAEVEEAYGASGAPSPDLDPMVLAETSSKLPLFIIGSPDDNAVPFGGNGLRLFDRAAEPGISQLVMVSGPHLGGSHFAPALAQRVADFLQQLDRQHQAHQ